MKRLLVLLVVLLLPLQGYAAIAFDASSADADTTNSLTFSHTTGGSDRILFCMAYINEGSGQDRVSGITYNGDAMTLVDKNLIASDYTYLFYLIAPDTGTNDVVISLNSSVGILGACGSYTGADQTSQPDSFDTNTAGPAGGATSLTTSTTVVEDDSWLVGAGRWMSGGIAAGTGGFLRQAMVNTGSAYFDSNAAVSSGVQSMQITGNALGAGEAASLILASFDPVGAAPVATPPPQDVLFFN